MRRVSTYAAAMLLLGAGCLGDLDKPDAPDGGSIDGSPGGDGGGDPDAGDTVQLPGDVAIRITTLVADLNGNGAPDLVLLNDPQTVADRGVLVYFDRREDFFAAPDQFLPTDELHPLVAAVGDFVGGAALDLMVVANDDSAAPYVFAFEGSGQSTFSQVVERGFPGRAVSAGSVGDETPVFATRAFVVGSHDQSPGLVFGDSDQALYVSVPDWTMVTASDDVSIDVGTTTMNVALPIPSAEDDRNDLLVLDNQGGFWLTNNGSVSGGFQTGPASSALWENNNRAFFVFDIEGDGIPDFMTLDQMQLHVGALSWAADDLTVDVRLMDPAPSFGDSFGDSLFAADIDGEAGMDLLVLDDVKPGSPDDEHFGLHVARNIMNVDSDTISTASGDIDVESSFVGDPTRVVAGDFDRDGTVEVWVFDASLELLMCLVGESGAGDSYHFNECAR